MTSWSQVFIISVYQKASGNWNSILKSKDITLLTKVHIVKAMVFPVLMYGCESRTIKKGEWWRIGAFKLWCWRRLESSLDCKIKPIWKRNQLWIFIGRLMLKLKLQYFCHLIWRANSLKKVLILGKIEGKRERGQQKMRWLSSISDFMDVNLSKLREIVKDREAWHDVVYGVAKSQTRLRDWTTTNIYIFLYLYLYLYIYIIIIFIFILYPVFFFLFSSPFCLQITFCPQYN